MIGVGKFNVLNTWSGRLGAKLATHKTSLFRGFHFENQIWFLWAINVFHLLRYTPTIIQSKAPKNHLMSPIKEVNNLANINKYRILLQATRAGIPPSDCTLYFGKSTNALAIYGKKRRRESSTRLMHGRAPKERSSQARPTKKVDSPAHLLLP